MGVEFSKGEVRELVEGWNQQELQPTPSTSHMGESMHPILLTFIT